MAYNLSTIRNRVLDDKIDDTSFDPGIVDNFINDTQRDIFSRYELSFQEKIFSGLIPTGAYYILFPTDYQQAQSIVLSGPNGNRELDQSYVPFRDFNLMYPSPSSQTAGQPTVWTIYGGKLLFNRPTDAAYTLTTYYIKAPTTLTLDADVPEIPEPFAELLVLGAYYRILQRNEDFDQAAYVKTQEFTPLLEQLVLRYGKRQSAKAITMRTPQNASMRRRSRV